MNLEGIRRVMELEAENERLKAELATARREADQAATKARESAQLVPLKQALAVFGEPRRSCATGALKTRKTTRVFVTLGTRLVPGPGRTTHIGETMTRVRAAQLRAPNTRFGRHAALTPLGSGLASTCGDSPPCGTSEAALSVIVR